jgi:hypothetical protein
MPKSRFLAPDGLQRLALALQIGAKGLQWLTRQSRLCFPASARTSEEPATFPASLPLNLGSRLPPKGMPSLVGFRAPGSPFFLKRCFAVSPYHWRAKPCLMAYEVFPDRLWATQPGPGRTQRQCMFLAAGAVDADTSRRDRMRPTMIYLASHRRWEMNSFARVDLAR